MPPKGRPQSEAQRQAAERNLRKGNPSAYTKASHVEPREPSEAKSPAPRPKTIRAKTSSSQPAPMVAHPTSTAPAPASESAPPKGHFLDDVLGGIFG